jgi:hypothetical protein
LEEGAAEESAIAASCVSVGFETCAEDDYLSKWYVVGDVNVDSEDMIVVIRIKVARLSGTWNI